jgi:carboxyl-terminal processing protease
VYGGGGITPDEKYPSPKYNIFQRRVGPIYGGTDTFYHFANNYFGTQKPNLPGGWQPTDEVMDRYRAYLKSQQVIFTDTEFSENRNWIRDRIRWEFYYRAFDKTTAERSKWSNDPEVLKAIESMPKAQALLTQAQKVLAMRQ